MPKRMLHRRLLSRFESSRGLKRVTALKRDSAAVLHVRGGYRGVSTELYSLAGVEVLLRHRPNKRIPAKMPLDKRLPDKKPQL